MAGLECSLGKRFAGEKSMLVGGDMVAGCKPEVVVGTETRSRAIFFPKENLKIEGVNTLGLFDGKDFSSSSENDPELRTMFDEWAIKYKKVYLSDEEREERFKIFLCSKEIVDTHNSLKRGYTLGLNMSADRKQCEMTFGCVPGRPRHRHRPRHPEHVFLPDITGMSSEELTEARIEFEKWAAEKGRVYCSEKDQEKRFTIFANNKRMVEKFNRDNVGLMTFSGDIWTDLLWWEMHNGCPCECERCCSK